MHVRVGRQLRRVLVVPARQPVRCELGVVFDDGVQAGARVRGNAAQHGQVAQRLLDQQRERAHGRRAEQSQLLRRPVCGGAVDERLVLRVGWRQGGALAEPGQRRGVAADHMDGVDALQPSARCSTRELIIRIF